MINFEISSNPEEDALDENIYDGFSSIKQLGAYNYFTGEREYRLDTDTLQDEKILRAGVRENVKYDFLSGATRNPQLTYPKLEKFDACAIEKQFLALKERIKTEVSNETVKKLYL